MQILISMTNVIKLLSLIVIIGSTVSVGALIAPVIFKELAREDAARVMIDIFARFDIWLRFAVIALASSKTLEVILSIINNKANNINYLSLILTLVIIIISAYIIFVNSPELNAAYASQAENFKELHLLSEKLHKVNAVIGIVLILLEFIV